MSANAVYITITVVGFLALLRIAFAIVGKDARYIGVATVFWLAFLYIGIQINMTEIRDLKARIAVLEKPAVEQKQ